MEAKINYQKGHRLRMFAGPNGSGKSTIYEKIKDTFDIGIYLNADDLEKELKVFKFLELSRFGLQKVNREDFLQFIKNHSLSDKALKDGYPINIDLKDNKIISLNKNSHSYESAILVDFIRDILLNEGKKISFETVMSHHSKIETLKKAQRLGYRNYLYYIGTESEKININRVEMRVKLGGHPVNKEKIQKRYYDSLNLLKTAVEFSYRSFIFDNSGKKQILILEINGEDIIYHHNEIPYWVDKYLINK